MADVLESLTIVVPAYNESQRIGATLDHMLAWLDLHAPTARIVVVDDGSRDDTTAVVQRRADSEPRLQVERADDAAPRPGHRRALDPHRRADAHAREVRLGDGRAHTQ